MTCCFKRLRGLEFGGLEFGGLGFGGLGFKFRRSYPKEIAVITYYLVAFGAQVKRLRFRVGSLEFRVGVWASVFSVLRISEIRGQNP